MTLFESCLSGLGNFLELSIAFGSTLTSNFLLLLQVTYNALEPGNLKLNLFGRFGFYGLDRLQEKSLHYSHACFAILVGSHQKIADFFSVRPSQVNSIV